LRPARRSHRRRGLPLLGCGLLHHRPMPRRRRRDARLPLKTSGSHMAKVSRHRLADLTPAARAGLMRRAEADLSGFIDRTRPIPSVACYVPRGKGSFPSVVMMTTIPAVVAGVKEICVITPPGPGGKIDAATLVAARLAGVETVYKCGGAQGIAAVAYGT